MPDPNPVTAWKYTSAYFDHALDAAMGIVHRPTFEAQLRLYLQGASADHDTAWHALRHTIYASGCRIILSESLSFHEANNTAWSYFENALALLAGTILFQTSITSIQALTVMAYYSQNFGSPCLEYMLCNNALALAVAKGLHRQPAPGWNLSSHEHSQRSSLFWALYCLEKQIIKQSGRPSIIDDSEVTCPIPKAPLLRGAFNLKYVDILIQLARFSSTISKRLSSIRVLQTGAQDLARIVAELDWQLRDLRTRLEPEISLGNPVNPNRLPTGINLQQTVYLNCFYHTTMLDIHNTLTYPWSRTLLGLVSQPVLRAEAERSFVYVVETCHAAMLTLHYVHINAATPVPLSFFTPIYVLVNLFICILQNPTHNQIPLALSLMDLGVGFFTRLHIATNSTVSMQFAKELASLAQGVAEKARNIATSGEDHDHELPEVAEHVVQNEDGQGEHDPELSFRDDMHRDNDISRDVDIEQWSTLVPADMDLDGINFVFPGELHHY
ncbi:hypothetical protein LTS08_003548 [Lithohypha guttulata]|nr:hypothetical protein LTS08_003548 [Lithohypha guttulata]